MISLSTQANRDSVTQFKKILQQLQRYKVEVRALKQEIDRLESQTHFKDTILDEKSKHIISCTAENIALRKENTTLKNKLKSYQKRRKKSSKKETKPKKRHLKMILQSKQLSLNSHQSQSFAESDENIQIPYLIMPECPIAMQLTSSASTNSNCSIQACKLSLPNSPERTNAEPNDTHHLTPKISNSGVKIGHISILKPIAENNENSIKSEHYVMNPITPITPISPISPEQSNENQTVHINEWNESFATIADSPMVSPQPSQVINYNYKNNNLCVADKSNVSDCDEAYDSSIFPLSGSESNFYEQEQDNVSEASGNTNCVYLDYNLEDIEIPRQQTYNRNSLSNYFSPVTNMTALTPRNPLEEFGKDISCLSELTLSDNDTMDIIF